VCVRCIRDTESGSGSLRGSYEAIRAISDDPCAMLRGTVITNDGRERRFKNVIFEIEQVRDEKKLRDTVYVGLRTGAPAKF